VNQRITRSLLFSAPGLLIVASLAIPSAGFYRAGPDGSYRHLYAQPEDDLYKSPIQMVLSRDGKQLYVSCENSNEVLIVDTDRNVVAGSIKVGRHPFGVALSPNNKTLYVSNRYDDTVSVVDLTRREVIETIPVGDDPHDLITDQAGDFLYVTNMGTDDVSVIDLREGIRKFRRLQVGVRPFGLALSPDGRYIFVSSQASLPVPFRTPPVLELSVIETKTQRVVGRRDLFSTIIGQNLVVSPDSRFVVVALAFPKNLLPETQVYQGWMVTNGFAIVEAAPWGRIAYLLLDEANLYFADPFGLAFSPDGNELYISSSGGDVVSALDMKKIYEILKVKDGKIGLTDDEIALKARHLGLSNEYVLERISTPANPKDVVMSRDGRLVYVANRLDDSLTVIDRASKKQTARIDLGGPKKETVLRKGEKLFNFASISFQRQLSCTTCHPEYHLDGLVYDIVAPEEGIGVNLVDNRTMRGLAETGPFKWSGKNPSIGRQAGPRAAQLFFRSHGFEGEDLDAVVKFIESLGVPPNRYAPADGRLNEFQRRGRGHFERAFSRDGSYIPVGNRCITCHPPPVYTNRQIHDIGSQARTDDSGDFDTPQLSNVFDNAPFMHDGRCYSLEEIWTEHNPGDTHGQTNDMAKEDLNDLMEYIKTLHVGEVIPDKEFYGALLAPSRRSPFRLEVADIDSPEIPNARYLGNEACAECHLPQYKTWLSTKHSRSWVMLGMETSMEVGSHFKMTAMPQNNAQCLTCHGTAAKVPAEFRVPHFRVEEGVKCERCHGPGEHYAKEEIMKDRQKAKAAGLRIPTEQDCLSCHAPKPSHQVLGKPTFDYDKAILKVGCKDRKGKVSPAYAGK
jgi:YVTN family beta-propeller protein